MRAWVEFVQYSQAGQEAVQSLQQHLQWVKARQVLAVWKKLTSRRKQLRCAVAFSSSPLGPSINLIL